MVYLRNIERNENFITVEFSPEDSGWWGHISVNINTREVECDSNEEYGRTYETHAKLKLLEIAKNKEDITKCTVMWY